MRRGREENLPKGGSHNRKIDDELLQHAVDILEGNPMLTLKQLNHAIRDKLPSRPQFMSPAIINMRKSFVDEFGINEHLRRTQGRSAPGDRVYRKVGSQKGPNVTVCCAVSPDGGLLHYQVVQGGIKKIFA